MLPRASEVVEGIEFGAPAYVLAITYMSQGQCEPVRQSEYVWVGLAVRAKASFLSNRCSYCYCCLIIDADQWTIRKSEEACLGMFYRDTDSDSLYAPFPHLYGHRGAQSKGPQCFAAKVTTKGKSGRKPSLCFGFRFSFGCERSWEMMKKRR